MPVYFIDVAAAKAPQRLNYQKTEICVVNLLATTFGDQRIKVNETQASKTVFGHFKWLYVLLTPSLKTT